MFQFPASLLLAHQLGVTLYFHLKSLLDSISVQVNSGVVCKIKF